MKRFAWVILILIAVYVNPSPLSAEAQPRKFQTKYTTVFYSSDKDMDDFLWRIGGQRLELASDSALASNRIDRVVARVQTILDMHPKNFKVAIFLARGSMPQNKVAFYERKAKSIYINVDYATDGVLAHEIAHAVIDQYFATPPPSKIQEILTQYVDKSLWSDY